MEAIEPRPQQMQAVFANVPKGVPVVMLNMLRFMEMIRSAAYREILVHRSAALEDSRLVAMVERGA